MKALGSLVLEYEYIATQDLRYKQLTVILFYIRPLLVSFFQLLQHHGWFVRVGGGVGWEAKVDKVSI